jgi:hypothetical protein
MDYTAVQAAIARLAARGEAPSLGNIRREVGGGSWRDIVRWKRELVGAGTTQAAKEAAVTMTVVGLHGLGDVIPPRPQASPPGAAELTAQVAVAQAALEEALAAETALAVEWMALKGQFAACEQAGKALGTQWMPRAERERRRAALRVEGEGLQEQRGALAERQQAARLRAARADEAVQRARRALGRLGREA